jgi:hypothetical protein
VGSGTLPFLQVRLSFEFSQYAMTVKTSGAHLQVGLDRRRFGQSTDTEVATGASDRFPGGSVAAAAVLRARLRRQWAGASAAARSSGWRAVVDLPVLPQAISPSTSNVLSRTV